MVTEDDLKPGTVLNVRQASNAISGATFDGKVEITWVENGNVHYRVTAFEHTGPVLQTPVERFLDIVNNQPRAR